MYLFGVVLHDCLPLEELDALLVEEIPLEAYREAREELERSESRPLDAARFYAIRRSALPRSWSDGTPIDFSADW